jgi:hypothetical protein
MVGQIFKELVKEKGEACTMDGKRHSKPFCPNWKLWCVTDSKHNKCAPIVEWRQLEWLLVWCARCELKDSSMIELVRKTLQMDDK